MGDDILSGGRVDPSTSGPNPPNRDDRDRDILLEQKEKQDQDAIGGTQFPPKPQPPPPIPEAPEVAPSLPVIPSFDFSISGSALEETREIARQTVVDVLKNVTINGTGPSFEGSAIAFNIPQQPPASEAFIFQGIMVPQPLPQIQPIQAPILPLAQPEPAQEIQSFVVSPPPRQQPPQEIRTEPVQEPKTTEVTTPVSTPVAISAPEVRGEAVEVEEIEQTTPPRPTTEVLEEPPQQRSVESDDAQMARDAAFDRLSEYKSFPEGEKYEGGQISDQGDLPRAKGYEGGAITDQGDLPRAEGYEGGQLSEYSTLSTQDEIKERREQERKEDPNFNRESSQRQRGETPTEFRERQEELRQERAERAQREEQIKRVREGDLTEMPSGMIPVRFTRADGQKKILALMATELVGVVEGATSGDRTVTLPEEDSFYVGGGETCIGLALYTKTVGTPPNTTTQVWIGAGTVAGQLPSGFNAEEGKFIASGGSGNVWAEVNINETTGAIVSIDVDGGGSTPNNTDTDFYYLLGYYEYSGNPPSASVTNYGCGSVDVTVCRNWFVSQSPFYGVTFSRGGS